MTDIAQALADVQQRIAKAATAAGRDPAEITLLAVSKTKPVEMIRAAHAAGQVAFGENYLQDALPKIAALRELDLEWHYIGRIQSNKTRDIAANFAWVHGIDKLKHAQRLNEQRDPARPPLQCCIQVNLSGEKSKGGVTGDQLPALARDLVALPRLRLRGLMTMPDPDSDRATQGAVFTELALLREQLNSRGLALDTLSMGMSGDLELAIAAGSTLVRVGTDIFGARD
jgi:pyridoxal phosphate enzyme (YggS family)